MSRMARYIGTRLSLTDSDRDDNNLDVPLKTTEPVAVTVDVVTPATRMLLIDQQSPDKAGPGVCF